MKNKLMQLILILFSLVFAIRVLTILTADRLYSMSPAAETGKITSDRAIVYLDLATTLDSTNADIYFQKYKVLDLKQKNSILNTRYSILKKQLHLLRHCINLCPSWPRYHLTYALTLERMSPIPNLMTRQMILSELQKATTLKPYSSLYQHIHQTRLNLYK